MKAVFQVHSTGPRANYLTLGIFTAAMVVSACHAPAVPGGATMSMGAAGVPNELTAAERTAGWRLLFDGRTLAGWRGLGLVGPPLGHWTVEDGAIKKIASKNVALQSNGQRYPGGDLITTETFRNFELSWDWKMTPAGNSGVKYNVSEALSLAGGPTAAEEARAIGRPVLRIHTT